MLKLKKIISWLLVGLWMLLIFCFSHQPATQSSGLSTEVTEIILSIVDKVAPSATIDLDLFHHIVRKNAHFFVYLILGILVINALRSLKYENIGNYKMIVLAILICALYAASDEIHQLFILGRAGQLKDVLIDSAGAMVGILGYGGIYFMTLKR